MAEDISRQTITVLVLLTLVVSLIGSWAVIDALAKAPPAPSMRGGADGRVMLTVMPPAEPTVTTEQATVGLKIVDTE